MNAPLARVLVCVTGHSVWIRITGRANFINSVDFKTLVNELQQQGCDHFALDLTECVLMDSTFLGVLAGFGKRLNHDNGSGATEIVIELLNPNARISELLVNLGVERLFKVVTGSFAAPAAPVEASTHKPTAEELATTSLEAHQTLMEITPDNVPRFKDVAQFLAEDLKRIKGNP